MIAILVAALDRAAQRFLARLEAQQLPGADAVPAVRIERAVVNPPDPSLAVEPPQPAVTDLSREPSTTVRQLIELRDQVFAAQLREGPVPHEMLDWLYSRLGAILAREKIETLQREDGPFDWQTQKILGTEPAPDGTDDDTIAATVRPGYRYDNVLFRPQEVIVYARDSG